MFFTMKWFLKHKNTYKSRKCFEAFAGKNICARDLIFDSI